MDKIKYHLPEGCNAAIVTNSTANRDTHGGIDITVVVNAVCGGRNFPTTQQTDLPEFTKERFPNTDPIVAMERLVTAACTWCPNRVPEP